MKRVCKFIPSSASLQKAVSLDDQVDMGMEQSFVDLDAQSVPAEDGQSSGTRTEQAAEKAKAKTRARKPAAEPKPADTTKEPVAERADLKILKLRERITNHYNRLTLPDSTAWLGNVRMKSIDQIQMMDLSTLEQIAESIE